MVTHLATKDFPFIRYRTGDVGVLDERPCSCGRGLPLLREVQGRSTDFVVAADGTVMHGLALIYVIRDLPGIETFKIVQENQSRVRVMLVAGTGFDPSLHETIRRGFRARLGETVAVEIESVPAIAAERSGNSDTCKAMCLCNSAQLGPRRPARRRTREKSSRDR